MKFSLYEMHNLVNRISNYIDQRIVETHQYNIYSDNDCSEWLAHHQVLTTNQISIVHKLIDARFKLRRQIQTSNEECGINRLVAEQKRLRDQLNVSGRLVTSSKHQQFIDADTLKRQSDKLAEATPQTYSYSSGIDVYTVPQEVIVSEEHNIKGFNKLLDKVKNQLVSLNHNTMVQIESDIYKFLEELELV